ncbi:hypothetical protein TNCV_2679831 [Trichonephila clavipes]|nr:hypothetical protein TNCV_2679831 [Trichonephila clavipes]
MEFLKNCKDFFKDLRLDTALNEMLCDTREFADEIDIPANFDLTQPRLGGERRLRRTVRSHQSQTLAQITTQLNDGASRTVSKRTATLASSYGFREPSTYESTIAQCSPSGCASCLIKRAQRLEFRGLETSSME